ncbi:MAG TPA: hypothetical protein VFN67_42600 [Polyangiales bacterium]|nr:hypothetical protein [Polyangiales bacterium]
MKEREKFSLLEDGTRWHTVLAAVHHAFARHIIANFSDDVLRALHDQLAAIYVAADADQVVIAYHQLSGSAPGQGLQRLLALGPDAQAWESALTRAQGQVPVDAISKTLLLALRIAEAERAPRRVLLALRERLAHQTTLGDDPEYYYGVAAECLEQYKQDSGYNIWQSLDPSLPEKTRAERALTLAFERWNITPEAERVLNPIDALKALLARVDVADSALICL